MLYLKCVACVLVAWVFVFTAFTGSDRAVRSPLQHNRAFATTRKWMALESVRNRSGINL